MVVALTILVFIGSCFQGSTDGFYIVSNPTKKMHCEKELRMATGKSKLCVTNKPILAIGEIDYVTPIQYDPKYKVYYIDIGITAAGMRTFRGPVGLTIHTGGRAHPEEPSQDGLSVQSCSSKVCKSVPPAHSLPLSFAFRQNMPNFANEAICTRL